MSTKSHIRCGMELSVLFVKFDSLALRLLDATHFVAGIMLTPKCADNDQTCKSDVYLTRNGYGFQKFIYTPDMCKIGLAIQSVTTGVNRLHGYPDEVDIVKIDATPREIDLVQEMCVYLANSQIPYNEWDKMVHTFNLVYTVDDSVNIFEAKSLHTSQAVVLILRGCLDKSNPIRVGLNQVNSRTMYSTKLHRILLAFV